MMDKRFRRFFFWLSAALCLGTAGFIVFHSFGYRYSFERGIFIYTGSLTLKTNPTNVAIRVDGETVDYDSAFINSTYHVGGLRPGKHQVEITADGFQPWRREALIESGRSTEFWNILLVRDEYPTTVYPEDRPVRIFPEADGRRLAVATERDGEWGVVVIDTETGESRQVFSSRTLRFDPAGRDNIEWSRDGRLLLLPLWAGEARRHMLVDVETGEATDLKDLTSLGTPSRVRWHPDRTGFLLFLSGGVLWQSETAPASVPTILAEGVADYDLSGGRAYTLAREGGAIVSFALGSPETRRTVSALSPEEALGPDTRLIVYDDTRLLLVNDRLKRVFVYNEGERETVFRRLGQDAVDAQFSNDGKKVLFWNENELFVYFTRDWEVQPAREENTILSLARFSRPLRNVQWADDYEHALFSVDGSLKLIELDHRGERQLATLIELPGAPLQVVGDLAQNRLYFVAPRTEGGQNLQSIEFPETTTLFGFAE